jgi:diguanylate cyclase (GGDEF)-like protein/PAS domain S-box-containing protein
MIGSPVPSRAVDGPSVHSRVRREPSDLLSILGQDHFRSLFETAPCAWLVLGQSGEIAVVNARAERMFGYSRDDLIGSHVARLIPCGTEAWLGDGSPGSARGELRARRSDGTDFPAEFALTPLDGEHGRLLSLAVTDVTERKLAAEALAHRASHDPLTGLPNRTLFLDRLEHALRRASRSNRSLAVMFLDLDDFKLVNDTRGHEIGDVLLVALTPKLTAALRPGDTIARFGGDEFVVLCEDLADGADAIRIARRIAAACSGPVVIDDYQHSVTISAGVVLVEDPASATPSSVLRDADAAMYRAKESGKGRIELFDERMRAQLVRRTAIESSLRRAIDRQEFTLHYQPVVSVEDGQIVSVEALLRWQHPHRGLVEPGCFMHVAESSGLIVQIGEWAISEACRQAAEWSRTNPVGVSVSVSPRQVSRSDLAGAVARALHTSGLDPGLLELEITEQMLFEVPDSSRATLRELKALGARLVLDDFGTGPSSFASIKHLTIDALKVDRSFVEGLGRGGGGKDGAIISAMLNMASALGVVTTAEGVETREQLSLLRAAGCQLAQGYLFSEPVPAAAVPSLLSQTFSAAA